MHPVISDTQAAEILSGLEAPRITLEYMESRIAQKEFIIPDSAPTLTICLLKLDNGFFSVGMSAPASTENYNQELGRKYSYENALRDLWGKFGFALSEKIHASKGTAPLAGIEVPVETPVASAPTGNASQPEPAVTPPSAADATSAA